MMPKIKEIKILKVASDNPKILKVTSLQLTGNSLSCFKRASFDKSLLSLFRSQTKDSLINPCSMPK